MEIVELTPEMIIIRALLDALREWKGEEACRKHIVGAMRQMLAMPDLSTNVVGLPEVAHTAEMQRKAARMLTAHCRDCGGCRLARG